MRKHIPARLLAYGLSVVAVAALAIAGAASADHWDDYNGTADTHEVVDGNPVDVGATLIGGAEHVAANAAKSITSDAYRHTQSPISVSANT